MSIKVIADNIDDAYEMLGAVSISKLYDERENHRATLAQLEQAENAHADLVGKIDGLKETSVSLAQYDKVCADSKEWQRRLEMTQAALSAVSLQYEELLQRYDSCAVVRDQNAAQLGTALHQIADMEVRFAEVDPGPDEQNKTLFNVTDINRSAQEGYAGGYANAKAELAAEAYNASSNKHIASMLEHDYVDVTLCEPDDTQARSTFRFAPMFFAPFDVARRLCGKDAEHLVGMYHRDTLVMIGQNTLTRRLAAFPPTHCQSWKPAQKILAEASRKD